MQSISTSELPGMPPAAAMVVRTPIGPFTRAIGDNARAARFAEVPHAQRFAPRRIERLGAEMRSVKAAERGDLERQQDLMQRMQTHIEGGQGLRSFAVNDAEELELRNYRFVTRLPELIVVNIGEDQLADATTIEAEFTEKYGADGVAVAALCAKIEA